MNVFHSLSYYLFQSVWLTGAVVFVC